MKEIIVETRMKEFSVDELPTGWRQLVDAAVGATATAYARYSHFHVGVAALLANGEVVCGSNQENAAYPSGLCAERVALFYAGARYPDVAVRAIAIAAEANGNRIQNITPCGACRQVLLETEMRAGEPVKILLCGAERVLLVESAKDLLPLSFDGSDLP